MAQRVVINEGPTLKCSVHISELNSQHVGLVQEGRTSAVFVFLSNSY